MLSELAPPSSRCSTGAQFGLFLTSQEMKMVKQVMSPPSPTHWDAVKKNDRERHFKEGKALSQVKRGKYLSVLVPNFLKKLDK